MFDCEIGVNCLQNLWAYSFLSFCLFYQFTVSLSSWLSLLSYLFLPTSYFPSLFVHIHLYTHTHTFCFTSCTHSTIFKQFHFHRESETHYCIKQPLSKAIIMIILCYFIWKKNMNDVYWNGRNCLTLSLSLAHALLTAVLFSSRKYVECTKQNQTK